MNALCSIFVLEITLIKQKLHLLYVVILNYIYSTLNKFKVINITIYFSGYLAFYQYTTTESCANKSVPPINLQ